MPPKRTSTALRAAKPSTSTSTSKKPSSPPPKVTANDPASDSEDTPTLDPLSSISGIKPLTLLRDGETREASSDSSDKKYTMKRTMDHYYCTCVSWRLGGGAVNARTCKHLKKLLGEKYEEARLEQADPGSSTRGKGNETKGKKRKAAVDDDEDNKDGEDKEEDDKSAKPTRKKRQVQAPKRLKDASFKPLLAHKWDLDTGHDPTKWLMSEKLDGVRAIWNGPSGTFFSREGNPFYAPPWFTKRLPRDILLDGELFTKRGGFQECVSIVRAQNAPEKWKFSVTFQIFDVPSRGDELFEDRLKWLERRFSGKGAIKWVKVLPHQKCKSREHLLEYLEEVTDQKGEGVMLRQPGSTYVNGRSKTLLKVKKFFDADAIVRGHETGSGKNSSCMGALRCEMLDDNGKPTGKHFKIGTGFTDAQRRKPPKVGVVVIYKYQELTKDGVPRFPSYGGVRADLQVNDDDEEEEEE
ncbi:DNA ligase/mRNA capping enzyme [Ascodesmis nigricans]|uniref:DNA ligase/mRNA capping enzyme n=1 Tax=Ascodesmis nigricans TaxID=341454 RepID=A0A4S2N3G0_9PEZI|nr:DNA ligase/mRNA capping enzyme [Ascodesmis nigricans]